MTMTHRIEPGPGGPVLVHRATTAEVPALRRRAERLEAAAHPGVVAVLGSGATEDGGWELRVAYAGSPLGTVRLPPTRLARVAGVVAATLADLHGRGVVHGRLHSTHVLIDPNGLPVLCGFGECPAAPVDPMVDVALLGRVILDGLDRGGTTGAGRSEATTTRALRALATEASDPVELRRPSMARLATQLGALAGAQEGGPKADARPRPAWERPPRGRRPPRAVAIIDRGGALPLLVVAAVTCTLAFLALTTRSDGAAAPTVPNPPPPSEPTTTIGRSSTPSGAVPSPRCVVIGQRTQLDPDDPCPHRVRIVDEVVEIDGARFRVGRPGDVIAIGAFRCAGDATVAVLRPSTGDVFAFPTAGPVEVTVAPVLRVPGALKLEALTVSDRCQQLRVVDGAGKRTPLLLRSSA